MKKISVWMLALMLVPGIVLLTGCKKNEENTEVEQPAGEPMAEATPAATDNMAPAASPTASPAAQ